MRGVIYGLRMKGDDKIFYVGQTIQLPRNRWLQHLNAPTPVGKALRFLGGDECCEMIVLEEVEGSLNRREEFWVAKLGTFGPGGLNQSRGGDLGGATPEARKRISERMKRTCGAPEFKAKVSPIRKALWQDPAYRTKVQERLLESHNTPEHKAKISAVKKAMWAEPGRKAAIAAKTAEQWRDPEIRAKRSAAIRAALQAKYAARRLERAFA